MTAVGWSGLVLVLALLFGCAASRDDAGRAAVAGGATGEPVTIDDVAKVVGRWAGLVEPPGRSGQDAEYVELEVQPDGTYQARSARTGGFMDVRGRVEVDEGRLLVQGNRGTRGLATLFARDGRPTLVVNMTGPGRTWTTARLQRQR